MFAFALWLTVSPNSNEHQANAQNATDVNFKLYKNPSLGFSIEYPSDWKAQDNADSVSFNTEVSATDLPTLQISVENVSQYLDTDTLTLKNKTIQQTAQDWQNVWATVAGHLKLLRQNDVTVAGNPGIKSEFIGPSYIHEVFTIINGKLYHFRYSDSLENVPVNVKLANKALETFKILNNN